MGVARVAIQGPFATEETHRVGAMDTLAVILEGPERMALRTLELNPLGPSDVLVEIAFSGISSGTEKLLWSGRMPPFPGMGYPLVPGYESVGRVVEAGTEARGRIGDWVFVPGANCYTNARGLFGGTARRVIVPSARALPVPETLGEAGVLFALSATALHAINSGAAPDLIVGHGVLGRLLARITLALGAPAPTVEIVLDLPGDVAFERALARDGGGVDRFESRGPGFQRDVAAAMRDYVSRVPTADAVDATGPEDEVAERILACVVAHAREAARV